MELGATFYLPWLLSVLPSLYQAFEAQGNYLSLNIMSYGGEETKLWFKGEKKNFDG